MAVYEYQNAAGERREIVASMSSPPPEFISVSEDGDWYPATEALFDGFMVTTETDFSGKTRHYVAARRVYSPSQPPIVKKYGVEYPGQALPVSRALPLDLTPGTVENRNGHKVLKHADGGYTDLKGRRIVANKADVERAEASTGHKRD